MAVSGRYWIYLFPVNNAYITSTEQTEPRPSGSVTGLDTAILRDLRRSLTVAARITRLNIRSNPMPNHLVIGKTGTIGSALFTRLESINASVYGTTHRSDHSPQTNIFHLNLLDPPTTWTFPKTKFDVVYLCAGKCRMNLCEDDPIGTYKINVDATLALARHFADQGALIVYLSTNQVFSGEESHVPEQSPYQPLNEYGRQKAKIEELIKSHCPQSAIVRLTKVVEPNMQLIQNWIDRILQNQHVDAFNDMMLAPVSLRQVINVLINIGEKKQSGCYHVSGAEDISYHDLAKHITERLDRPTSLVKSVSAIDAGIKKIFLPRFTTLDCSSTIDTCDERPPQFIEVLNECFDIV